MPPYRIEFEPEAEESYAGLDKSLRNRIDKTLSKMERDELVSRHLKRGLPVFVEEVAGYRIAFKVREELKQKRILFVGDHKAYERWYREQESV